MDNRRLTGVGSGAVKYDILTALTVTGLNSGPGMQLSMARLTSLITARYNWRTDILSMGQTEMARLWGVGDRTVKREVKRWLDTGLLICQRNGVRGRVAAYRLNLRRICDITRPHWALLGPDFEARMASLAPETHRIVRLDTVRRTGTAQPVGPSWSAVLNQLAEIFPAQFDAWLSSLDAFDEDGTLILEAKSAFAAEYVKTHFGRDIFDAVQAVWGASQPITIRGPSASRPQSHSGAQTTRSESTIR